MIIGQEEGDASPAHKTPNPSGSKCSARVLTYSKTRQSHIVVMRCEVQAARHFLTGCN